jgi:hypothetical protein
MRNWGIRRWSSKPTSEYPSETKSECPTKLNRGLDHSADPEEIDDLERFLTRCLPKVEDTPAAGL